MTLTRPFSEKAELEFIKFGMIYRIASKIYLMTNFFDSNEEGLELLTKAIELAGEKPDERAAISLDIAASEFKMPWARTRSLKELRWPTHGGTKNKTSAFLRLTRQNLETFR